MRAAVTTAAALMELAAAGCGRPNADGGAGAGTSETTGALSDPAVMSPFPGQLPPAAAPGSPPPPTPHGLEYHGGPVMAAPINVYLIWYGTWNTTDRSIVEDFVSSVGGSSYFRINTTFFDATGASVPNSVRLAGETNDSYTAGKALGNNDIGGIVRAHVAARDFPLDPAGVYIVIAADDVTVGTFCQSSCGFHAHTTGSQGTSTADLKYAFVGNPMVQCPGPNACAKHPGIAPNASPAETCATPQGDAAAPPSCSGGGDAVVNMLAHELSEAATDPDLNAWILFAGSVENGDICGYTFGTTYTTSSGATANVHLGSRDFLVQRLYVNSGAGFCALSWQEPPLYGKQLTVSINKNPTTNSDSSLEVMYLGTNDVAYHTWQQGAGGDFNNENLLGATANRGNKIVSARDAAGRLQIVYIGTDNRLHQNAQVSAGSTTWGADTLLATVNNTASQLALGVHSDNTLELFYIGLQDGILRHIAQSSTGAWGPSALLGTINDTAKQLAVATNDGGPLEVFYVGGDDVPRHMWQNADGSWSPGTLLGDGTKHAQLITVAKNKGGRLEAFLTDPDDVLMHALQVPSPSWTITYLGTQGEKAKQMAVGQNADGRLELFYTETSNVLYHKYQTQPDTTTGTQPDPTVWTGEAPLNAPNNAALQIAVGRNADKRLELFYVGTNNVLYHTWQVAQNGTWSGEFWLGERAQDGQACFVGNNCASGVCSRFYVDLDNDGYPNAGESLSICGTTAPPGYFPARSDGLFDCFDQSASVHPGVTSYFTSVVPGWTFDYNCSGVVESNPQNLVGCSTASGSCTRVLANYPPSSCGNNVPLNACGDPTGHGGCALFGTGQTQLVTCH